MKGQSSIEYLMIIGVILLIIIPIFYYAFSSSSSDVRINQANSVVEVLKGAANTVYSIGPGSKKYVWITVPDGVVNSNIDGDEISLKINLYGDLSDVFSNTKPNVTGQIPIIEGRYQIPVEMLDSGVVVIGNITTVCGDGVCDILEDCYSCSEDCGTCVCGNNICEGAENCNICPEDCGDCGETVCEDIICGDSVCSELEDCITCQSDCGECNIECGDGVCVWWAWEEENCDTCPEDCLGEGQLCCPFDTVETWWFPSDGDVCPAPVVSNCGDLCASLDYQTGVCRQSEAQCTKYDETWEEEGDSFCIGGPTGDFCCCVP